MRSIYLFGLRHTKSYRFHYSQDSACLKANNPQIIIESSFVVYIRKIPFAIKWIQFRHAIWVSRIHSMWICEYKWNVISLFKLKLFLWQLNSFRHKFDFQHISRYIFHHNNIHFLSQWMTIFGQKHIVLHEVLIRFRQFVLYLYEVAFYLVIWI